MKTPYQISALILLGLPACSPNPDTQFPQIPTAAEVAAKLPPIVIPTPKSPVDLRTALLTLPADAVAEMSLDGRRNLIASRSDELSKPERRFNFSSDNPYMGFDAKSMFFIRVFEDEQGRSIAASHSARPFADGSAPSAQYTRIYRLETGKWMDITRSALPPTIPAESYFRFGQEDPRVPFGPYEGFSRRDSGGKSYTFAESTKTMTWKSGAFRQDR